MPRHHEQRQHPDCSDNSLMPLADKAQDRLNLAAGVQLPMQQV